MRRLIGITVAIVTAILNWLAFVKIGGWVGASEPEFFASILLLSIALHEIAHMIVMESYGVMTHVFFAVILGGAMPDPKYGLDKLKNLNWHQDAAIALAGVTANVAIIIGSIALHTFNSLNATHMFQIINMNGGLIVFNLLPFGTLDGGRFAKAFFDSVPEHKDQPYAIRMGTAVALATLALLWFGTNNFPVIGLLVLGLNSRAFQDDPLGHINKKAMTISQQHRWAVAYDGLVIAGAAAVACSMFIK